MAPFFQHLRSPRVCQRGASEGGSSASSSSNNSPSLRGSADTLSLQSSALMSNYAGSAGQNNNMGGACNCRCPCCPAANQLDALPLPYLTFSSSLKLVYANAHARVLFPHIPQEATAAHFFARAEVDPKPASPLGLGDTTAPATRDPLAVLRAQLIGIADEQAARSGWGSASLLSYYVDGKPQGCMVAVKHYAASAARLDSPSSTSFRRDSNEQQARSSPPSPKGFSSARSSASSAQGSSASFRRPRSAQQMGIAFSVTFLSVIPDADAPFAERASYFLDRKTSYANTSFNSTPNTSPSERSEPDVPLDKLAEMPASPMPSVTLPEAVAKAPRPTSSSTSQAVTAEEETSRLKALVSDFSSDIAKHESISSILSCENVGRAMDELPQIVWLANPSGQIIYLNKRWYEYTGVTLDELQDPARWLALFHPEDLSQALEKYGRACRESLPLRMQYRVKGKDGTWRWMYANGKPLFDAEGKPWTSVAVLSDVEELVITKSEADRMRKHISAVLAGSELFLMTVDTQQVITLLEGPSPTGNWQPGQGNLCIGKRLRDVIPNKTLSDAIRKLLSENLVRLFLHTFPVNKSVQGLTMRRQHSLVLRTGPDDEREDHKTRHIRYRLVPLRENGTTHGVIVVGSDVSRVVEAEEALEKSAAERVTLEASARAAREASRLKTAFTTTMSHEIRSPIAGMIGVYELLLADTRLPASAHALVEKGLMTGELLLDIVGRVLDFGKIEAGKLEIESKPFVLSELVADTSVFTMQAEKRGIVYRQNVGKLFDGQVRGDRIRVRQVLFNGLSNAVKFTKQGNITLNVKQEAETAFEVLVHFEITDTGVGIDKSALGNLFKPFTQADSSTARRFGGSGLGLAISRDLVKLMGGTINISSVPGEGTTLSVVLPFEKEKDAQPGILPNPPRSPETSTGAAPSSLSLGDLPGMTVMMTTLPTGARVMTPPAVAAIMGDSTGYIDVIPAGAGSPTKRPPITTRVSSSILLPRVSHKQMVARKTRPEEVRILVAEDNELLRDIVSRTLEKMHFNVESVENGALAVDAVATGRFDLVLMDGQMPEKSGYAATAEIRRSDDPHVSSVKIIALTASAVKGDRERCLEAGMDSYLSKPVRAKELEAAIWNQLRLEGVPPLSQCV